MAKITNPTPAVPAQPAFLSLDDILRMTPEERLIVLGAKPAAESDAPLLDKLAVVAANYTAGVVNTAEEIVPAIESAYSAFQLAYMARRAAK